MCTCTMCASAVDKPPNEDHVFGATTTHICTNDSSLNFPYIAGFINIKALMRDMATATAWHSFGFVCVLHRRIRLYNCIYNRWLSPNEAHRNFD